MFTQSSRWSPSPRSNVENGCIGGDDRQVDLLDVEVLDVPVARVRRHFDDDVVLPAIELVRTVGPERNVDPDAHTSAPYSSTAHCGAGTDAW